MRIERCFFFSCAALAFGLEAAAQTIDVGQEGASPLGDVYASLNIENAAACARLCEIDGLCLGWTFLKAGSCELKAIAAAPMPQRGFNTQPSTLAASSSGPPPLTATGGALLGGPLDDAAEALRPRLGSAGTW